MIYFDNNATTRLDPRVLEAMLPFLTTEFANASSTHKFGIKANEAVKEARQQIANLIHADPKEVIFTSGATEAINIALKGFAEANAPKGKHIITVETEHPAVLDVCRSLEAKGLQITYLPVQEDGLLDISLVEQAIRPETILVSVMWVNNETGVIQPIKELASIAHQAGAIFMTDATQAVGKIPINVREFDIDILTLSGHKFHGPKGVGALFVREQRSRKISITPLQHGGGHERGLRSGTLNVSGIVGIGTAAAIALSSISEEQKNLRTMRDYLESNLLSIPDTTVNGNTLSRIYSTTNICFRGCDSDALILGLDEICVSNGSACTAASLEPSHVLVAMGKTAAQAFNSLRFSLGRFNTIEEVKTVIQAVKSQVSFLRTLSD